MEWRHKAEFFIITLILLNVLAVILGTVEDLAARYQDFFRLFEIFSVVVFSVEYLLRLWSCTSEPRFKDFFYGRLRYAASPPAIIDLLAVLPFYLPMILPFDLRFLRLLRLLRLGAILKLGRYSKSLKTIGHVLSVKKEELLVAVTACIFLLIFASCIMYYFENEAQPENFSSIPATMWWGVATLTTVGYGDVYPVTTVGKIFGAIVSILGIGLFALPTGILASGFGEMIHRERKRKLPCPHCGGEIEE